MMFQVLLLTQWEWFKLSHRWMPWVTLAIAVVFTQAILWGGYLAHHSDFVQGVFNSSSGYTFSYSSENQEGGEVFVHLVCEDVAGVRVPPEVNEIPDEEVRRDVIQGLEEFRAECLDAQASAPFRGSFVLPGSIATALESGHQIGVILILVVAASIAGAEYGWGSLRMLLTRGVGRWQVLASKFLLVLLAGAVALVVIAVLAAASSLLAAVLPPEEGGGLFDTGSWTGAAAMLGKAIYGLAPYAALGIFLAVLTASPSMGLAFSLGYYFVELIAAPIVGLVPSLERVPDYLIGQNVNAWMNQGEGASIGAWHAFFVLLAYILLLGAGAFFLFLRRDITGAKGL